MKKPLPAHSKRLAELVMRPGGLTRNEAVQAAELKLERLRDRGLAEITETIGRMQAIASKLRSEHYPVGLAVRSDKVGECLNQQGSELYGLSNSLVGIAGVFGKDGLGRLALSLCSLVERLLLAHEWDAAAVTLHLDSMRLVCDNEVSAKELSTIELALAQVMERLHQRSRRERLN